MKDEEWKLLNEISTKILREFERRVVRYDEMDERRVVSILYKRPRELRHQLLIPYAAKWAWKRRNSLESLKHSNYLRRKLKYRRILDLPPFIKILLINPDDRLELLLDSMLGEERGGK